MTTKKELEKRIEDLEAEIALLRPRPARAWNEISFGSGAAALGAAALMEQMQMQFDGRPSLR